MKKGIHPDYKEITVVLSDGSEIKTRSTINAKNGVYHSEVDSKNHPFYTKSTTFTTSDGRVDRFKRRYGK